MSEAFASTLSKIKEQAGVLNGLDERAVELGVVIPLLRQLGWDTDNMSEVYPQKHLKGGGKTAGDGKVDYALQINEKCLAVIEVKRWSHQLNEGDEKNQLEPYCLSARPGLAILTNGHRWRFYRPPTSKTSGLRPFLHFDIDNDFTETEEHFLKFLARNVVLNGSAVKVANSTLRELQAKENVKQATLDAVNLLPHSQDFREFLAAKVENATGSRPSEEAIDQILEEYQVKVVLDQPKREGKKLTPKPSSCTFMPTSESSIKITTGQASWNTLLANLCLEMRQLHHDAFSDTLLTMRERFTCKHEKYCTAIGDTGLHVKYGDRNATKSILPRLLNAFGYPPDSVTVTAKDGTILYPDTSGVTSAQ